ncbi:MAG: NUDIX domain-containing protein [Thauera sp.]|nr:NUDIX domain-containing protein [Thauera sp.]
MVLPQLSCGLLVINEQAELLVGHSTGSSHWDLPKGLIEPGEHPIECALREAREEFGLEFPAGRLVDLGRHPYYRGKDLHLFAVSSSTTECPPERCRCSSYFAHYRTGQSVPEIDGFAWADEDALRSRLGWSMRRLLLNKGVLRQARDIVRKDTAAGAGSSA